MGGWCSTEGGIMREQGWVAVGATVAMLSLAGCKDAFNDAVTNAARNLGVHVPDSGIDASGAKPQRAAETTGTTAVEHPSCGHKGEECCPVSSEQRKRDEDGCDDPHLYCSKFSGCKEGCGNAGKVCCPPANQYAYGSCDGWGVI